MLSVRITQFARLPTVLNSVRSVSDFDRRRSRDTRRNQRELSRPLRGVLTEQQANALAGYDRSKEKYPLNASDRISPRHVPTAKYTNWDVASTNPQYTLANSSLNYTNETVESEETTEENHATFDQRSSSSVANQQRSFSQYGRTKNFPSGYGGFGPNYKPPPIHLQQKQQRKLEQAKANLAFEDEASRADFELSNSAREKALKFPLPQFVPLPDKDTSFVDTMIEVKSKKGREKYRRMILEGRKLVAEALLSGVVKFHKIYFSDPEQLRALPIVEGECEIYRITPHRMKIWSELTTPPGIFAIVDQPDLSKILERQQELTTARNAVPLLVVCDNIRDPGNLGSIIRTVTAAGCEKIVLTRGCVNVWDQKVLRGGMGAHFHIPIYAGLNWHAAAGYMPLRSQLYLADSSSFDVAAEVESYKTDPTEMTSELNNEAGGGGDDGENKEPLDFRRVRLPVMPYSDVRFTDSDHVTLVIGGETSGLGPSIRRLATEKGGVRIHVPMGNGVESLNAATAIGILVFEIKRQFLQKLKDDEVREAPATGGFKLNLT